MLLQSHASHFPPEALLPSDQLTFFKLLFSSAVIALKHAEVVDAGATEVEHLAECLELLTKAVETAAMHDVEKTAHVVDAL
jgi:hypothetical protein